MEKKKKIIRWIVVIAAVLVVLLIAGGCRTMIKNHVNIRGQHLNSYSNSSGGGMTGGFRSRTVKRQGDKALITIESAKWYYQDPTVTEYLADAAVLDELETVVRKHHMNFWHQKEFTHEFVYDGETESYRFGFDEERISFSSQIYPMRYARKLAELDRVVDKYISSGEKLPGLVMTNTVDDEIDLLEENVLAMYVYSYADHSLGIRVLNGTDEDVEIPESYTLRNADTGAVIQEQESTYNNRFYERTIDEIHFKLKDRLPAGRYTLLYGENELPFEIR